MTPQRVVSARAAASGLVIRRLESMQSHANRQVVHARVPQPSPAGVSVGHIKDRPGYTRLGQVIGVPVMQGHCC